MQDNSVRERLRSFCQEAAVQLAADAAAGESVPFELVDAAPADGAHQPLYCYRTLTGEFVRQRLGALGMLPSYLPAAHGLERLDGLDEWLLARGEQHVPTGTRDRADAALRVFLAEVLGETSTFEYEPEGFESAWDALEAIVFAGEGQVLLAAALHGVRLESPELRIESDLMLVSPDSIEAEALPGDMFRSDGEPVVLALVEASDPSQESLAAARSRLRKLLCALRMFGDASPALGGAARMRVERGPWQVLGLEGSGSARGTLTITRADEEELKAFSSLVSRRWPRGGETAWAVRRHEFGCDRMSSLDGLSDHLAALRALLEPEGPASGRLMDRLAALCAEPEDRARLAERTARAAALERSVISGLSARENDADTLCREIESHLRALLRDVIFGHLDSDLCGLADSIIAESAGVKVPGRGFGDPEPLAA